MNIVAMHLNKHSDTGAKEFEQQLREKFGLTIDRTKLTDAVDAPLNQLRKEHPSTKKLREPQPPAPGQPRWPEQREVRVTSRDKSWKQTSRYKQDKVAAKSLTTRTDETRKREPRTKEELEQIYRNASHHHNSNPLILNNRVVQ